MLTPIARRLVARADGNGEAAAGKATYGRSHSGVAAGFEALKRYRLVLKKYCPAPPRPLELAVPCFEIIG
jgi:hypothetical protein